MCDYEVSLGPLEDLGFCVAQLAAGGGAGWKREPERLDFI